MELQLSLITLVTKNKFIVQKKDMKLKLVIVLIGIHSVCFSQRLTPNGEKIFYSLAETEAVNPDSVFVLCLGNNNLKEFPIKILKFKNLNKLTLCNFNTGEMLQNTPWLLTEKEVEETRKIFKKHPGCDLVTDGLFPIPRKNRIKSIPEDIGQLKNLRLLILNRTLSHKEIEKLKSLLPDCAISVVR
ncbi:hypothetical protein [Aurantibacillus circumpalustris]|uniref:hypothetical protein n=1 Tax=Aurantibacillus circumpalustris TaxID=3036359 RepID=UPI00295B7BC9|nr:hypothetical protein [Aurantibacillus circumpalustris]